MTNELPTEHVGVESQAPTCEEYTGDNDVTASRNPMKEQANLSFDDETHPNSPWGSFRDGDSRSTSSNSSWGTAIYTDMRFTMLSNLVFLIGSCIQTYTSIVDLKDASEEELEDDDWDDDYDDDADDDDWCDDDYVYTIADKTWYVLYSLGPLLYIINSLIDVKWLTAHSTAHSVSPWSWKFWCRCFRRRDNSATEIETPERLEQYQRIVRVDTDRSEGSNLSDNSSYSTMESHIETSYGTDIAWQLVAAFTFGLGAFFEFYGTFLDDYYEDEDDWDDDSYLIKMEDRRKWYVSNYKIEFIGMHLYLLSGFIMLIAQRDSYRSGLKFGCCFGDIRRFFFVCEEKDKENENEDENDRSQMTNPDSTHPTESSNRLALFLMLLGTVLFVCGTLLDCTIAWLSDPELRYDLDPKKKVLWDLNEFTLAIFDLISSLLWNVDAFLYICADILLYSLHKKGSKGRKWLFKRRVPCSCMDVDDDSMERDANGRVFVPMFRELSHETGDAQPLLRCSSITTYSSL